MKNIVKIKAPANSLASVKLQIEAGADEVYLGMFSPEWFANLSFSHRGRANLQTDKSGCIENKEELKEIVQYAHDKGITISYTANLFNLPDTPVNDKTNKNLIDGYLDYVQTGIDCNVDSVIVANLNQILVLRQARVNVPLTVSCLFMISNIHYYELLREFGIYKMFLPHDTCLLEMKQIAGLARQDNANYEIGIFCHFSCAMLSGGCHWYHKFGEAVDIGYPCRNKYKIQEEGKEAVEAPFFDYTFDCSLCQLPDILNTGVNSLKLVGRSSSPRLIARLTSVYRFALDNLALGDDMTTIRQEIIKRNPWWSELNCQNDKCKYKTNSKLIEYLIG